MSQFQKNGLRARNSYATYTKYNFIKVPNKKNCAKKKNDINTYIHN